LAERRRERKVARCRGCRARRARNTALSCGSPLPWSVTCGSAAAVRHLDGRVGRLSRGAAASGR